VRIPPRLSDLFLEPLRFPLFSASFSHPLRGKCSVDAIAADCAPVAVDGAWPIPSRRRMGEIERNLRPLEFRFGDGHLGDGCLSVNRGAAVIIERARERAAAEIEL